MNKVIVKSATSRTIHIHIAGDYHTAVQALRKFGMLEGFCASLTSSLYVYSGGAEEGVRVTLLNYPRYPKPASELDLLGDRLARYLLDELCQGSCSIEGPEETLWLTRRGDTE